MESCINPYRQEIESRGEIIDNPIRPVISLTSQYFKNLSKKGEMRAGQSASELYACLCRAAYGYDLYIKECDYYGENMQTIGKSFDLARERKFFVDYHVRAVYAELWITVELTRKGNNNRSPLPGFNGKFGAPSFILVRNKLLNHPEARPSLPKEIGVCTALSTFSPYNGPVYFPDQDLDGKGTHDPGFVANVRAVSKELCQGICKFFDQKS